MSEALSDTELDAILERAETAWKAPDMAHDRQVMRGDIPALVAEIKRLREQARVKDATRYQIAELAQYRQREDTVRQRQRAGIERSPPR